MVIRVEYMCKDVSSVELGNLGNLIDALEAQGWQVLDESEARNLPQMFTGESLPGCPLWMKRRVSVETRVYAA